MEHSLEVFVEKSLDKMFELTHSEKINYKDSDLKNFKDTMFEITEMICELQATIKLWKRIKQ